MQPPMSAAILALLMGFLKLLVQLQESEAKRQALGANISNATLCSHLSK
jgi:hypothetical protein